MKEQRKGAVMELTDDVEVLVKDEGRLGVDII